MKTLDIINALENPTPELARVLADYAAALRSGRQVQAALRGIEAALRIDFSPILSQLLNARVLANKL